jgi:hypothetical protein
LVASLTMIILQTALLAIRSPPWLSRCRFVLPDEAGMGEALHKLAKGAFPPCAGVPIDRFRRQGQCALLFDPCLYAGVHSR